MQTVFLQMRFGSYMHNVAPKGSSSLLHLCSLVYSRLYYEQICKDRAASLSAHHVAPELLNNVNSVYVYLLPNYTLT